MISEAELNELVGKTVAIYNRLHSPEAIAKILVVTPVLVTIAFSGSFCYSCGVTAYLDDFAQEFKMLTDRAELKIDRTRKTNPRTFEADFKVKIR